MSTPRAVLVGLAALTLAACSDASTSVNAPHVGRRADAIQGGITDATSAFAVAILDDQNGICSGTLIAPNLVLTARHCVAPDDGGGTVDCKNDRFLAARAPGTLRVSTSAVADIDSAAFKATKVIVPTSDVFCGNDLALLVLDKLVPAAVAVPAAPAIDAKLGPKLTAIGYGVTSPGANDDGTRRTRTNVPIRCVPGDGSGCTPADFDMTAAELAAGNGLCEGDSGSGAYDPASLAAGKPIVMGVLSRAADDNGQCADAVYVRTDAFASLLLSAAKEAAATGGYALPSWAEPKVATKPDAGTAPDASASPDDDAPPVTPVAVSDAPASTTTTTTSCAATASRASDAGATYALVLAAAALVTARRRRR